MNLDDYELLVQELGEMSEKEAATHSRNLCRTDLYFLLRYGFGRKDLENQFLFDRCKEVQENPNGHLDLWAREHYKSTIISYGKTIQDILASHGDDPLEEWDGREATFGIFSFNRPLAKKLLGQIKTELETNKLLKEWFPDVLFENPEKDSKSWSLDTGVIVRRKSNPREATVEAWGLVDSMPTGSHFIVRVYDDVITEKFARSPEMIDKATESWALSLNLGARGGYERYIGTRYHGNDTYSTILRRGSAKPRIYPACKDGDINNDPFFLSREELEKKRRDMGPYVFACQMMQNPVADEKQGFNRSWVRYHKGSDGSGMNVYILVDPASEKKKTSDYTVMSVIGLGQDKNYYLLDMSRDRMNLKERTTELFRLHRKWRPKLVGYEKYGMQADTEHIQGVMEDDNYRFELVEVGGGVGKTDRIKRLIPLFSDARFYIPGVLNRCNYEGKVLDLVDSFLNEEYDPFPVSVHDDMLDSISRIFDIDTVFPRTYEEPGRYEKKRRVGSAWSS